MHIKKIFFISFFLVLPNLSKSLLSEELKHECGVALVRLLKPISYYQEKYKNIVFGLNKLCLLMEKQRNRGQDGAGISVVKMNMTPSESYMYRLRSASKNALEDLLLRVSNELQGLNIIENCSDEKIKQQNNLIGELYLGHLRYGTCAGNGLKFCQPCIYKNNIPSKSLVLAGNFNIANSKDLLLKLKSYDIHPSCSSDTCLILNHLAYLLDKAYELKITQSVFLWALHEAASSWDGGYVFAGALGSGEMFICRDPAGIRPAYYYKDEEVFAAASERAALMSVFNVEADLIHEIDPAQVVIIKNNGSIEKNFFTAPATQFKHCLFERIYFSRASDPDIYNERKLLGKNIASRIFNILGSDLSKAIFGFVPNTSEPAFAGLVDELRDLNTKKHIQTILENLNDSALLKTSINALLEDKINVEKIIYKDQAVRTFISNESIRSDLVSNTYEVVRGIVHTDNTLVIIDDSIVRGTTLRESLMKQLIKLNPKKIIFVSSAPIIFYPDCYGIDMSQIGNLIGFQAAVALTKERGNQGLLDEIYIDCINLIEENKSQNPLKKLYDQFLQVDIENKVAELIYPQNSSWSGEVKIVYQSIEGLHNAIPNHGGDWYFSGEYPTTAGYRMLCNSYINWYRGFRVRAY